MKKIKKIKEIRKLIIDRRRWLRGEGEDNERSFLYRSSDKKMCCLGFYCRAIGYSIADIRDVSTPVYAGSNSNYEEEIPAALKPLIDKGWDTALSSRLMCENDDQGLTLEVRENRIRDGFKEMGVEVEFIN